MFFYKESIKNMVKVNKTGALEIREIRFLH